MKIKDILGEDGDVTVKGMSGDQAELSNGQKIDAKTLTPDPTHPGQFKAPEMDPNAIKPGAVVSMGDQQTSEEIGDETKKVFKHHGEPVGEIGIDPEASPGGGNWYVKHYASGHDTVGFDNAEEAMAELKYIVKHHMEEGHHDLISQGNHDVGGDATDSFINQVRDKEFERKNRNPSGGTASAISGGKLKESDELMKWLTIAGIK